MPRDRKYQTPSVVSPTMARVLIGPGRVEEEAPLGLRDPGEGDIERFLPAELPWPEGTEPARFLDGTGVVPTRSKYPVAFPKGAPHPSPCN
jgi:hypothetical protein